MNFVEMPNLIAEQFVLFVQRSSGKLPNKRRNKEFTALKEQELLTMEKPVLQRFWQDLL